MTRSFIRSRGARRATAAIAGLLVAVLPPGAPARAQETFDRGIDLACPQNAPNAFTDDDQNVHHASINCVAFWEIALGVGGGLYQPGTPVRRDQMATFVANMMRTAGHSFPAEPDDAFEDDEGNTHEANINALAGEEVVKGAADGGYHPAELVTRDQMATFVNNAIGAVTGAPITAAEDFFGDDEGNTHEANINALASEGIVQGVAAGRYDPRSNVLRAAMATFIARSGDHLAGEGHWPPVGSNQAFDVTPVEFQIADTGGVVEYTADVPSGTVVSVGLFRHQDVRVGPDGRVSFADVDSDNRADEPDTETIAAELSDVTGSTDTGTKVNDVESDGTITFTVSADDPDDVVPVVWEDAESGNDALDLLVNNEPSEKFGAGGRATFVPAEAGDGERTTPKASIVNIGGALFVSTAGATYYWDDNDTFSYKGEAVTLQDFEAMLNPDDLLDVDPYAADEADSSSFDITDDVVHAPPAPSAQTINDDDGPFADDVQVILTYPGNNSTGTTYDLQRAEAPCDDQIPGENPSPTTVAEDVRTATYVDRNVRLGCYRYRLRAVGPVSDVVAAGPYSNTVTSPAEESEGDATPPRIRKAQAIDDDEDGAATGDDAHEFFFTESMAASTAADGSTYLVSDPDGDEATITCGSDGNASCTLNSTPTNDGTTLVEPGQKLTVTLTAGLNLSYPLTIISVNSQWVGDDGNQLDLKGSSDRVINVV